VLRDGKTLTLHTKLASVSGRSGSYLGIAPAVVFQTASPLRAIDLRGVGVRPGAGRLGQAVAALPGALPSCSPRDRSSTAGGQVTSVVGAAEATGDEVASNAGLAVQGQLRAAADRVAEHLRRRVQHAPAAAAGRRARRHRDLGADPGLVRPSARPPDPGLVDISKLLPVSFSIFIVVMFFGLILVAADIVNPLNIAG
jgi:hypothetical protein